MSMYRNPLQVARGAGSAKEGAGPWWVLRLTAFALIFATLWIMFAVSYAVGDGYAGFVQWMRNPFNCSFTIFFIICGVYHGKLGLQEVIADYIRPHWLQITILALWTLWMFMLGIIGIFCVLRIAFGG